MKLTEARKLLVEASLWSKDSYETQQIDRALQFCLTHFVNETHCIKAVSDVVIPAEAETLDLASTLPDFMPAMAKHYRIGFSQVRIADYEFVRSRLEAGLAAGRPRHIAFETFTNAMIAPKSDQEYTLTVAWTPPLAQWTPGTSSHVEINIADRLIRPAIWTGGAAALVYGEANGNNWPVTGWRLFLEYVELVKRQSDLEPSLMQLHPYSDQKMMFELQRQEAAGRN